MSLKKSSIIEILGLLSQEMLTQLSLNEVKEEAVAHSEVMKQAAGAETFSSSLESIGILSAKKHLELKKIEEIDAKKALPDELDILLVEKERFRLSEEKLSKMKGLASYQKNTNTKIYTVTTTNENGEEKSKLAIILGVLINAKQE